MVDKKQEWLEISLVVSGELAEAVSDVLTRYITGGVVIENAVKYDPSGEHYSTGGEARICGYILADEFLEEKRITHRTGTLAPGNNPGTAGNQISNHSGSKLDGKMERKISPDPDR